MMPPHRKRGRPSRFPETELTRVLTMHRNGVKQEAICAVLNADGVRTPGGGRTWWPSHVSRLLRTVRAQDKMAELWPM